MAIKTHIKYGWLVPLTALCGYFIAVSARLPIGDFGNYYYASEFLLQGRWGTWIYEPASFNLAIYNEGQRHFFLNYTPVPPLSAIIYLPFAALDAITAKMLWNVLNVVLLLFSLHRLQSSFRINNWVLVFIPVLFFTPIRNSIYEGQSYFLLFFLLSEGLVCYLEQKKWIAVLLWGLSIHLKISPAFVLLFLLFEKDWKSTGKLAGVILGLLLLSLPPLGTATWINYSFHILRRLFNGEINDTYAVNYQSMQVLLKTLFVPDLMHNPNAPFNYPVAYHRLLTAFSMAVYGMAALCSFTKAKTEIKYCTWLICSLLVSGYGNSFSLLLLLLPLFCFHEYLLLNKAKTIVTCITLFFISNLPLSWFSDLPVPLQFPRLYLLLSVFIGCLFLVKPFLKPYYFIVLCLVFFLPINSKKYTQNYFLPKEEALLIYDFKLQNDSLHMLYFDYSGPQHKSQALPFHLTKADDFRLDKKVFAEEYGNLPKLVNDSIIIYLSDKNRGVGFYTLRYENLK